MSSNPLPFSQSSTWARIRRARMRQDDYTYQRCGDRLAWGRGLTVHHIIPRPAGDDSMDNLMSLCHQCHDEIEGGGLTRHEIEKGFDADPLPDYVELTRVFKNPYDVEEWRDIDWRIRVYGGVKDIEVARQIMAENSALEISAGFVENVLTK